MKDGVGYLLNCHTICIRLLDGCWTVELLNCPTIYITAQDICWFSHTLCIMLKDICWSLTRSLSHYRTFTTESSRLYYNVEYLERCAVCTRRKSHATHFIKKSKSKLACKHHPSSVPSIYEKSQRLLPSLSVHFIDTVGNTLRSISCFTRKILRLHCKDRRGNAVYCEKRTEHIMTLCGQVQRIRKLEQTIFVNNQLDA